MANRTPTRARSFAALIAILALMTLSLGSALAHDSTRDAPRPAAPAAGGGLTTNVGVVTNDGHLDESSEQETVDEANDDPADETEVDENDQGEDDNSVDENDQGQDEQADENDQNDQADENDDSGNDEADSGDSGSGGGDESDDGGEGGDD